MNNAYLNALNKSFIQFISNLQRAVVHFLLLGKIKRSEILRVDRSQKTYISTVDLLDGHSQFMEQIYLVGIVMPATKMKLLSKGNDL